MREKREALIKALKNGMEDIGWFFRDLFDDLYDSGWLTIIVSIAALTISLLSLLKQLI